MILKRYPKLTNTYETHLKKIAVSFIYLLNLGINNISLIK